MTTMTTRESDDQEWQAERSSKGQVEVIDTSIAEMPDRWCFGLSHPYIQRLIFRAGELDGPYPHQGTTFSSLNDQN